MVAMFEGLEVGFEPTGERGPLPLRTTPCDCTVRG